jgi:hypothetical protein
VYLFPVSETFYFTNDTEGGHGDWSIKVQFNDGATARISGTCRIGLPVTKDEALALVTKWGFRTWVEIEDKLLLPIVRRSLMMTANLMSSKESYSDKRVEFFSATWDQIENGIYVTKDITEKVTDPISGQIITKIGKTPLIDEKGQKVREHNPLKGTGLTLSNFEIKDFIYEDVVQKQISSQQAAVMEVQTARANALKADQAAYTAEAEGKAKVMTAKYEMEQEKVRATVGADKEREVATINAQKLVDVANKNKEQALVQASQEKEVAAIGLEKAKLEKQTQIELGQGESERKRLVLEADGALAQKLDTLAKIHSSWADAFSKRQVPSIMYGGVEGGTDTNANTFMSILQTKLLKDLSLDADIKGQNDKKIEQK